MALNNKISAQKFYCMKSIRSFKKKGENDILDCVNYTVSKKQKELFDADSLLCIEGYSNLFWGKLKDMQMAVVIKRLYGKFAKIF